MKNIISIVQLVVALILIVLVVLQETGGGVGESFGGGSGFTAQKRGLEKYLHIGTIVGLIVFIATSLANLLL